MRHLPFLFTFFLSLTTLAQDDIKIKAFIVQNNGLYKLLKHKGLRYDTVLKYIDDYPPLQPDSTYSRGLNKIYAGYNSCIIFYFFKNGKEVRAEDLGYSDSLKVVSNEMNYAEMLQRLSFRKHKCSILKLSPVSNAYRSPSELYITLMKEGNKEDHRYRVPYDFLPGKNKNETIGFWKGAYEKNQDSTMYYYVHWMVRALRDPMYLTASPLFFYPNSPYSNLDFFDLNILEGNFSMPFTIMQGRDDQARFFRSASIDVIPEFTWRISSGVSAPLYPLNTKVGLAFNKTILDKDDRDPKWQFKSEKFDLGKKRIFKTTSLSVVAEHFSNGQNEGATMMDDDGNEVPDFFSGNFSVNSVRARVMRNQLHSNFRQISWGGMLRYNIHNFDFEEQQKKRYGHWHLGLTFFAKSKLRKRFFLNKKRHHSANGGIIRTPSLKQTTIRVDLNYVIDNIDDFEGYNRYPLRRGGVRVRFINDPVHNRSVGWFTQLYYGRDYLNIRYNVMTYSAMIGITFNFNKDIPPLALIKKELDDVYDKCRSVNKKNCFRGKFLCF